MTQAKSYQKFHRKLHHWYQAHGRRNLPWRNTDDSYAIYISEIMLQQTQVKTVLERFYTPFLTRFPTLQALADAPRDAVLKQWEGLGYYNRAANLHEAAKRVAPQLPQSVEELEALPGIGRNTAHAIAAFSYHQPVPVMEANVKRVLCRIFAILQPKTEELWDNAFALLDKHHPFDYNQAMMDIGATICTKRAPNCADCPANEICKGKSNPESYPEVKKKKAVPVRAVKVVIWRDSTGRYYLSPREGAFLRGLYGFSYYPAEVETVYMQNQSFELEPPLGQVSQTYSHFQQIADVYLIQTSFAGEGEGWYLPEEMASRALAGIDHKIWALLQNYD